VDLFRRPHHRSNHRRGRRFNSLWRTDPSQVPGGAEKPSKAHASQPAAAEDRPAPARARRSADDVALAVLPLENFSGDAQQDAFADAMTEALQSLKSEVRSLR